jgi:hypothetical protein
MAQPRNDSITGAVPVAFPSTGLAGTTIGATNDGLSPSACGNSATSADVWYTATMPGTLAANTQVAFSTCGNTSADTVVQVFAASAGGSLGAQIACDDDNCLNRKSRAVFNANPNAQYYIRVATRNATFGNFVLNTQYGTDPRPVDTAQTFGPDVTIGDLSDVGYYGTAVLNSNGVNESVRAFAVGTDSWNIGDRPADWFDYDTANITFRPIGAPTGTRVTVSKRSNEHPVIAQQMYRYLNGSFEQIGISWLKHGFTSTNSTRYNAGLSYPSNTTRTCAGGGSYNPSTGLGSGFSGAQQVSGTGYGSGDFLVINCADLYGASLNGSQGRLGPRYDVNALNGIYTHPYTQLVPSTPTDTIGRRLLVRNTDWGNPGARYFVDAVYVTSDDTKWNNGLNNYSAREVQNVASPSTTTGVPFVNSTSPTGGGTARRKTALQLWPEIDPAVKLINVDYTEQTNTINDVWGWPNQPRTFDLTARYQVASRVTDNGNGTWTYRYAILNMNSHRSLGSFSVPIPGSATASAVTFKAPFYHSGDRVNNNPWIGGKQANAVKWAVDMSFNPVNTLALPGGNTAVNFLPNALRWGVMHTYSFTTTIPPRTAYAKMTLQGPPADATGYQGSILTATGIDVPQVNIADIAGPGQSLGGEGSLTADDIIVYLNAFFAGDLLTADVAGPGQSPTPDGTLTADDIIVFLNAFFAG